MPIANGTEPVEAVVPIDVLRRAGAEVTVASVEKKLQIDACRGVKIVADALISDCADNVFDLISLPVSTSFLLMFYCRKLFFFFFWFIYCFFSPVFWWPSVLVFLFICHFF